MPAQGTEEHPLWEPIVASLREVYDPEIPVNIYDIGLIYTINIDDNNKVDAQMTLTSPACPAAGILPEETEEAIRSVEGVSEVNLELVWDPPWDFDKMSEDAKLSLGLA